MSADDDEKFFWAVYTIVIYGSAAVTVVGFFAIWLNHYFSMDAMKTFFRNWLIFTVATLAGKPAPARPTGMDVLYAFLNMVVTFLLLFGGLYLIWFFS